PNYEQIRKDLLSSPEKLIDGKTTRQDLIEALAAIRGEGNWPDFNQNRWNEVRMYVRSHHLLKEGEIAKFKKIATPQPSPDNPVWFEVSWVPENWDRTASRLMGDIIDEIAAASVGIGPGLLSPSELGSPHHSRK